MRSSKINRALVTVGATAMMAVFCVAEAQAGWGSHGSWGGSRGYSSYGSSGGSWGASRGSYASRGGPIRNMFGRIHARYQARYSGGSYGSYGSSGGSWGSRGYASRGYGSSGGYRYYSASSGGSRGYYGSSGYSRSGSWQSGVIYSGAPVYSSPVITSPVYTTPTWGAPVQNGGAVPAQGTLPATGQPTPADDTPPPGPSRTGTGADEDSGDDTAVLNLRLPGDAVVYVNGKRTRTEGSFRSYVSRNLQPGKRYTYEVRAEVDRGGKTLARTRVVQLTTGANKTFDLEFDDEEQLITSLTVIVPDDAQVSMGGVETRATGNMRYFSTTTLSDGEKWENYKVLVTVERDGQQLTREKIIDVKAGDSLSLQFDFELSEKVASR